jgi:DNA-binding CsgD family transcriptional regulator
MRVMRNYLLDVIKTSKAKSHVDSSIVRDLSSRDGGPEVFELADTLESVLTARELECLRLRAEGFCYEDVADILGIRSGTVGALLARAHAKARKALGAATGRNSLGDFSNSPKEATNAP